MSVGTLIVALVLLASVSAALFILVRDRRSGRCTCGANCGCCSRPKHSCRCDRPVTVLEPKD